MNISIKNKGSKKIIEFDSSHIEKDLDDTIEELNEQAMENEDSLTIDEILPMLPEYKNSSWIDSDLDQKLFKFKLRNSTSWIENPAYEPNHENYQKLALEDSGHFECDDIGHLEDLEQKRRIKEGLDPNFWEISKKT